MSSYGNQWFAAGASGGWSGIQAIARFDNSSTSELTRDQVTASNQDKWTYSWWVKRGSTNTAGENNMLAGGYPNQGHNQDHIFFMRADGTLRWEAQDYNGNLGSDNSNTSYSVYTQSTYNNTTDWYHLVLQYDSTQSTSSNRIKWYVDGTQQSVSTRYSGYPAQNRSSPLNAGVHGGVTYKHYVGHQGPYAENFEGRLGEVIFIDGSIYAPSQFAHDVGGTWTAKNPDAENITWGTNGHWLQFLEADNLGKDTSGNDNNFTVSNIGTDHKETSNLPPTDSS